ncbi:NF038143 family protein [Desulfurivibrio alkaliphilus]|uniref:Uncharacterized protein n=1 Tax=Desulfurivibrio alkaliphilus (strain DSM 19089 / UNIQEM U267 / AHT2) TaxID=589865 RepID=D6Z6L9_DESAT|nr:NF038143 family protein [Desulfurivibrio alkaliphilus]ADH84978.1 hypothetical protein DaAHT2_0267 [Desulfurivibrio alkaliphilus AHT 2]
MEAQELQRRSALIREYEEGFAHRLATRVINKPKLNIWLFLVPFLFIYHFSELRRYKENLPALRQGLLRSKLHALTMAEEEIRTGQRKSDAEIVPPSDPELAKPSMAEVRKRQEEELRLLLAHYRRLLGSSAEDYGRLVRQAYGDRRRYQDFIEDLQQRENELNQTLLAAMARAKKSDEEAPLVVERLEKESLKLRVADMQQFFPLESA